MTDAQRKAKGLTLAEKHANTALAAVHRLAKVGSKYGAYVGDVNDSIFPPLADAMAAAESAFKGKKVEAAGIKLT